MRQPSSTFPLIGVLFLTIQLLLLFNNGVHSQVILPTSNLLPTSSKPLPSPSPNPTNSPSPHPPSPSPTSAPPPPPPPPPSSSSSSFSPIIPLPSLSSLLPIASSAPLPSSSSASPPSSSSIPPTATSSSSVLDPYSSTPSSSSSSSSSTSSPLSSSTAGSTHKNENTTPSLVGGIVGGVVGLALLGGLLAWLNRRGGCTSKTNQRKANFEDFGLAERDFPHHRSPAMTSHTAMGGATVVASPTIPQLNEHGNYYNNGIDGNKQYQQQGYDQQQYHDSGAFYYPHEDGGGGGGGGYSGYETQQVGYDTQGGYDTTQTGGYDANGGYYDEHGYYYDGQPGVNTGYEGMPPPGHQQVYHQQNSPSMDPQDIHKPNATTYS